MFAFHDGSATPPEAVFPVQPNPAIERVLSAFTNAKSGDSGASRFFRGLGAGTICTYVGDAGLQSYTRGAVGAATEALVRFDQVDRLCIERTRLFQGSSYMRTALKLNFRPRGGDEPLFSIDADHQDTKPQPPASPVHFATAAERAWNAYILPRILDELVRTGVAEFGSTHGFVVRVTADELSAGYTGRVSRTRPRREIAALWVENGRLYVEPPLDTSAEVAGSHHGNFAVLLVLLQQLGYPLR
jgi:hypothetical protein